MVRFNVEVEGHAAYVTVTADGENGGEISTILDKSEVLELVNDLLAAYNQL